MNMLHNEKGVIINNIDFEETMKSDDKIRELIHLTLL